MNYRPAIPWLLLSTTLSAQTTLRLQNEQPRSTQDIWAVMMRGVQKQNSKTTTSAFTGVFQSDVRTRTEFLRLME